MIGNSDIKTFTTQEYNSGNVGAYQTSTEGFLRFNATSSADATAEKEAGAKLISESRKMFYIR